jgi:beta-lactamase regulating signal transducer with metallopeptidase domain/ankyrin repeat protein
MKQIVNDCLMELNKVAGVFYSYAAGVFIQSALLVILLFVIDLFLRKRVRAVFRYCLWLLVLVKLVLPPVLSLPTGIGYWVGDHIPAAAVVSNGTFDTVALEHARPSGEMPHVRPFENVAGEDTTMVSTDTGLTSLTWQAIVFLLWIAGVMAFLAVLVQRIMFVRGLVAAGCPAGDGLTGLLEQCRRQMTVKRDIKLRLSEAVPSPAVCGLLRPIVLMPVSLVEKLSPEGLRAASIHELAHIKRGDLWVNSVQTFLQVVYFYNPFVWFANSMIRKVCEEAVDETVLVALGGQAKHYSNTLIDIAEIVFWKADLGLRLIGVAESKKALQWRIRHMLNRPIPKSSKLGIVGIVMLLVIAAILLPMAKAQKPEVTNEPVVSENESKLNESLLKAVKDGNIEKVKSLIAVGANVNAADNEGTTTLIFAIVSDHRDVVELLLAKGADINAKDKRDCAPMIHAVCNRNLDIINLLLDNRADVNTTKTAFDAPGVSTPLHEAIYNGSLDIVRLLIDDGADINAIGEFGRTPLQNAIVNGNRYQIELLLDQGVTGPVFHVAACKGDLAEVKRLLAQGMSVDEKDEHGCTPLFWSVAASQKEMVEFLLTSGADVNIKNKFGHAPLHRAIRRQIKPRKDLVKLLIAKVRILI